MFRSGRLCAASQAPFVPIASIDSSICKKMLHERREIPVATASVAVLVGVLGRLLCRGWWFLSGSSRHGNSWRDRGDWNFPPLGWLLNRMKCMKWALNWVFIYVQNLKDLIYYCVDDWLICKIQAFCWVRLSCRLEQHRGLPLISREVHSRWWTFHDLACSSPVSEKLVFEEAHIICLQRGLRRSSHIFLLQLLFSLSNEPFHSTKLLYFIAKRTTAEFEKDLQVSNPTYTLSIK